MAAGVNMVYSATCLRVNDMTDQPSTFQGAIAPHLAAGELWPQIQALLETALPYGRGEYTIDDIREGIEAGHMLAIGAVTAGMVEFVATCVVVQFPQKRVLYVQYGAGRQGHRLSEVVKTAARALQCDWIETRCREEVARLYKRAGYDVGYQVCILEVGR